MAHSSINEFRLPVNEEMQLHDGINEYLSKAIALSQVALHDDFLNYSDKIVHDYLWALSEMLEKAYEHYRSSLGCSKVSRCTLDTESALAETE